MVKYALRYNPKGKKKSTYLKSASGRIRIFNKKSRANEIKKIYDYKPKIRVVIFKE